MDVNAYYALGIPAYVVAMLFERELMRRRGRDVYGVATTIGNLSGGLGEVLIGLFLGPLLFASYDWAYRTLAPLHLDGASPATWALALVGSDLCYYVYHRAGHSVAALWAIHGVHHQAEELNLSVALRHPWLADVYAWVFYAPMPLLGVPPGPFFAANAVISFYALTVHSRAFHRPGFGVLVTPATHIVHHSRNPRYIGRNLGAMLTVWDRLFGTHVEVRADDPPEIGTPAGYETHDGARSQWVLFRDLVELASRAPTARWKLRVLLGRPGTRPPGIVATRRPAARAEERIPPRTRRYAAVQFTVTLAWAVWALWYREGLATWHLALSTAAILGTVYALGGLLDGRSGAARLERARVVGVAAAGAVLAVGGQVEVGVGVALATLIAAWAVPAER